MLFLIQNLFLAIRKSLYTINYFHEIFGIKFVNTNNVWSLGSVYFQSIQISSTNFKRDTCFHCDRYERKIKTDSKNGKTYYIFTSGHGCIQYKKKKRQNNVQLLQQPCRVVPQDKSSISIILTLNLRQTLIYKTFFLKWFVDNVLLCQTQNILLSIFYQLFCLIKKIFRIFVVYNCMTIIDMQLACRYLNYRRQI